MPSYFLLMSPPGCPVGLSFHPLKRQLFGVALAVGGRSLEERRLGVVAVPFAGWPCEFKM